MVHHDVLHNHADVLQNTHVNSKVQVYGQVRFLGEGVNVSIAYMPYSTQCIIAGASNDIAALHNASNHFCYGRNVAAHPCVGATLTQVRKATTN